MLVSLKWLLILTLTGVHAQEPRKRTNARFSYEEPLLLEQNDDDVSCSVGSCVKRSPGQDEFGPFWANRGKKDPMYTRSKFYADEPHWILVRREDRDSNDNEPFYVTRGKKTFNEGSSKSIAAQFWRTLFAANSPKKFKYLQNLGEVPMFLDAANKKGNAERSNFQ